MSTPTMTSDEQRLAELGYKQELHRGWSSFSNFAISFAIICVLAGCLTTYGQAWNNGGPIAISIGWPVICVFIMCVALSMAELASAYPTAGGIYYWASKLGGPGWGWFTGWFNLVGLIAVVASVDYAAAIFLQALLGLYEVNFIFNFTSTNVKYDAHVIFALMVVIMIFGGMINVFSSQLLALVNRISVWWNVIGVAAVVLVLILVPSHHQSASFVFTHQINNSGFGHGMFWFYVLPISFLLTMYTITGYDASAHLSEETHDAAEAAAKGVWRSVFYSAMFGWILLLAVTFAATNPEAMKGKANALPVFTTALTSAAAKAVILIAVIAQLFCGVACLTSASRMSFAFSRDGAIPGHRLWRRLSSKRTPTWAVLFVTAFAIIVTIPALLPQQGRRTDRVPGGHDALDGRPLHRLHDPHVPALAHGRQVQARAVDAGQEVQVAQPHRHRLGRAVHDHRLAAVQPGSRVLQIGFSWSAVNYAPLVMIGIIGAVTIWWFASAKRTFTGPVRTIDELDTEISLPDAAQSP